MSCRRWNKPGIPHVGWFPLWVEELDEVIRNCETCDTAIRYVHHIVHPDYGELGVGRQCATKMTGTDAKSREEDLKRFQGTRRRWIESGWEINHNGNPRKKERRTGRIITVFEKKGRWRFVINPENQFSIGTYGSNREAQAAAFDFIYAAMVHKFRKVRTSNE